MPPNKFGYINFPGVALLGKLYPKVKVKTHSKQYMACKINYPRKIYKRQVLKRKLFGKS